MKYLTLGLVAFLFTGIHSADAQYCSPIRLPKVSAQLVGFYEKSLRRDPTISEVQPIFFIHRKFERAPEYGLPSIWVKPYGSAFLLQSEGEEVLVASARHLFDYDEIKACAAKQIIVESDYNGIKAFCKEIVLEDPAHDLFIFSLHFEKLAHAIEIKKIQGLNLTACVPATGSRLKLLGHPNDFRRSSQVTVSENCEIMPKDTPYADELPPYRNRHEAEIFTQLLDQERELMQVDTTWKRAMETIDSNVMPEALKYNCSTWGGNSGGPIILEEMPNVAVALPFSYLPTERPIEDGRALLGENIAQFVQRNRVRLRELGIKIDERLCQQGSMADKTGG